MSLLVGISVTVVPDGFTDQGRCRLSLQVIPRKAEPGEFPTVDLLSWPSEIQKLAKCIRIAGATVDASVDPVKITGEDP